MARLAAAAEPSARVGGVDLNAQMLDVARAVAPLEWIQASADSIPSPDGSFTLVICQQGLHFLRPHAAPLEVHRFLAPRGRLIVSVWCDIGPGFQTLADALNCYVWAEAGAALSRGPASLRDPAAR